MFDLNDYTKGGVDRYTMPGLYPLYYVTADSGVLSPQAVEKNLALCRSDDPQWRVVGAEVNWEDPNLFCEHTGKRIPSAYGPDPDDD